MLRRLRDWFASRRVLLRKLELEKHLSRLKDEEIAALRRQLGGCLDTLDRHAWQQRATGAEAMVYAETLKQK